MTECYACAKLAELTAENSQLRVKVDKQAEVLDLQQDLLNERDETESRVITSHNELFEALEEREADTREKLEADVKALTERWGRYGGNFMRVYGLVAYAQIIGLLDRQAAITEHTAGIAAKEASKVLRETNADLREDVAERDDVIAVLKAENAELQSRHCEWSDPDSLGDGCMLRKDKRVDELTSERDELRSKLDELAERKCPGYEPESHYCRYYNQDFELNHQTVSRLKRENAELARDLHECMAERDGLRRENAKLSDDEFYLRCTLVDIYDEVGFQGRDAVRRLRAVGEVEE